ncbi:MAG: bifunctional adenosylcobinamide kinase/adenosylcobinamide-phosphate guanylyltransferase [Campylobacterota bacterium]|nr:bifunctional adenosylcobinamide kinase/adenosylcobinamide-phosphate guanylyltransferase [Campylobacterota bacterium]
MKILYVGGQKSGKSSKAEKRALKISKKQPVYIATYNNSYDDKNMIKRIKKHILQRKDLFKTVEQTTKLHKIIKKNETYLIDCLSMWLLNHLELSQKKIIKEIKKLLKKDANIIFVLNDVNHGVIPIDKISRKYIDLSGIIGQLIASKCDKVIRVDYGIETKLK